MITFLSVAGGGVLTLVGQYILAWRKGASDDHATNRTTDAKLEEHRDSLTFDLLKIARDEVGAFREEVKELRQYQARVAHLEEALDHVHALLHAGSDEEWIAAERRARAFMRRMRPSIGDMRNMEQANKSAEHVEGEVKEPDNATDKFRVLPPRKPSMSRLRRRLRLEGDDDA